MLLCEAVAAYVTDRRARGELLPYSARQMAWRLGTLVRCHPGLPVAALDRAAVLEWQRTVGDQRPSSRRIYLSSVRVFCAWAVDEGLLAVDPTARLAKIKEPGGKPRSLSAGQYARLVMVLPDERAQLIVGLMRHSGLRCVEVARLTGAAYDPARLVLRVTGKGGDWREVPVYDDEALLLDRWAARAGTGLVVGLGPSRISRLVSIWMGQAGLKTARYDGVSAHALRHTAAARMLDACGNVRTVQGFLGHKSLATTNRYVDPADMDAMRAAQRASA